MTSDISIINTTLLIAGFKITLVQQIDADNAIIVAKKFDILGAHITYAILVNFNNGNANMIQNLQTTAKGHGAFPIIVSNHFKSPDVLTISFEKFDDLLGGFVNTGLVTLPNLADIMDELGHNRVPDGLDGKADALLETYTKECLRYLLCVPTRRFGSDRSFESLPDGIALGGNTFNILFDAKAYEKGYGISADDVRRFSGYINDFNDRYRRLYTFKYFLIVSGEFTDSETSIQGRSDELFNNSSARLCCITARELAELTQTFRVHPLQRNAIKWPNIFINPRYKLKDVNEEITRVQKDKVF